MRSASEQPDDRIGGRPAGPDTGGAEEHGEAGESIGASLPTVREWINRSIAAQAANAEEIAIMAMTKSPARSPTCGHLLTEALFQADHEVTGTTAYE